MAGSPSVLTFFRWVAVPAPSNRTSGREMTRGLLSSNVPAGSRTTAAGGREGIESRLNRRVADCFDRGRRPRQHGGCRLCVSFDSTRQRPGEAERPIRQSNSCAGFIGGCSGGSEAGFRVGVLIEDSHCAISAALYGAEPGVQLSSHFETGFSIQCSSKKSAVTIFPGYRLSGGVVRSRIAQSGSFANCRGWLA